MRIKHPLAGLLSNLLVLSALLYFGLAVSAVAQQNPLRIGAHVALDDQWAQNASEENRSFVANLRTRTSSGTIESLPNDRLYHLFRTEELDCILTGGWPSDDRQLRSKQALVFEVRLFTLSNTDLRAKDQILVGRMKQFPPPTLPLENTMVDWMAMQNLQQGFDLLRANRIDAILAAPSHIPAPKNGETPDIVPADLPPVKRFEVPLLCHDTPLNREIVEMIDLAQQAQ